jgi:hypothetical protein
MKACPDGGKVSSGFSPDGGYLGIVGSLAGMEVTQLLVPSPQLTKGFGILLERDMGVGVIASRGKGSDDEEGGCHEGTEEDAVTRHD